MLGKLIKHDFRALSRTLLPMQLGVFAAALIAGLFMTILMRTSGNLTSMAEGILTFISVAGMVLIWIAIFASGLVTLLLVALHFYHNLLCDEGYLTFTLPTTSTKILLSKVITGTVWILINGVIVLLSAGMFALVGTSSGPDFVNGLAELWRTLVEGLPVAQNYINVPLFALECILVAVLGVASELLHIYLSIALGNQIARKHKLLATIGMYLLISLGLSILTSFGGAFLLGGSYGWLDGIFRAMTEYQIMRAAAYGLLGGSIAWLLILSAAYFLWTRWILKKRLNLQ